MEWYLDVLQNHYADFNGRARRKEYWMFTLFNVVIIVGIAIVTAVLGAVSETLGLLGVIAYVLYALVVLVPGLAVAVRRLHDTGKSGWFLLAGLVPVIGGLIVLYFMIIEGDHGPNEYGPNPKSSDPIGLSASPIGT
ncbi:DUF805 domain-containing protein [Rubrivirga sp.]|uniref:DUF805 domain-containing protein n=1 Tax=Rubrivirga sp. TaxID=1885344 RepID=UPI003C735C27